MTIGGYETVRLLGKGGMSEVYEAVNPRLGSHHALKLFVYEKDDPEVRRRFEDEGRLLARLSHPRIVKVTDFGTDQATGKPYFVMDLVLDGSGALRARQERLPRVRARGARHRRGRREVPHLSQLREPDTRAH
jgi:serine/threonine-protein kinase